MVNAGFEILTTGNIFANGCEIPSFDPRPPWWGGDLQTIRNMLFSPEGPVDKTISSHIHIPVGNEDETLVVLKYHLHEELCQARVLLIHGMGGDETSLYLRQAARYFLTKQIQPISLNLRCAGPSGKTTSGQYHAGLSEDIRQVVAGLLAENNQTPLFIVGFSLGGNMILKALGEDQGLFGIVGAVAVSPPLKLSVTGEVLHRPRNRIYEHYLLKKMKRTCENGSLRMLDGSAPDLDAIKSVYDYDSKIVTPLHGFDGVQDYYDQSSCCAFIQAIKTPTLVIHSADDPWIPATLFRQQDWGSGPVTALLTRSGGHVGFHGKGSKFPWHLRATEAFFKSFLS